MSNLTKQEREARKQIKKVKEDIKNRVLNEEMNYIRTYGSFCTGCGNGLHFAVKMNHVQVSRVNCPICNTHNRKVFFQQADIDEYLEKRSNEILKDMRKVYEEAKVKSEAMRDGKETEENDIEENQKSDKMYIR